jgi:hypothetical protein
MTKWEYMVVYVSGTMVCTRKGEQKVQEFLDRAGNQGWELVTAVPVDLQDAATTVRDVPKLSEHALYLKRESGQIQGTRDLSSSNAAPIDLDDI